MKKIYFCVILLLLTMSEIANGKVNKPDQTQEPDEEEIGNLISFMALTVTTGSLRQRG